jgi:hypothetical protein
MEWIESLTEWAKANDAILWWLFAGSLTLFLLTPLAVGWIVVRMPADYFTKEEHRPLGSWEKTPAIRIPLLALKNLLGVVLLVAGLLMLMMPGQGLITVLIGVMLIDFPGKFRLQRWLVTRRQVWRSINWLRRRAHKPELKNPS